ncbi:CHAT domain-containing protein [Almyronema epifaneia]|uniref:CHAT domain-containing protein n=1 Tax=Almyronema epifaneia S1 TaxID=2991925 RepID=A0ABW6IE39_9CYAN
MTDLSTRLALVLFAPIALGVSLLLKPGLPLALPIAQAQTADPLAEANRLFQQAQQATQVQEIQTALELWRQALALYQQAGDRNGELQTLYWLGQTYLNIGQYQQGARFTAAALALPESALDLELEVILLMSLGFEYSYLNRFEAAVAQFEQRIADAQTAGDRRREMGLWQALAHSYFTYGNPEQAIAAMQQQLAIADELGDWQAQAEALSGLFSFYTPFLPADQRQAFSQRANNPPAALLQTAQANFANPEEVWPQWIAWYRAIVTEAAQLVDLSAIESQPSVWRPDSGLGTESLSTVLGAIDEFQQQVGATGNEPMFLYQAMPLYLAASRYEEVIQAGEQFLAAIAADPDSSYVANGSPLTPLAAEAFGLRFLSEAHYALGNQAEAIQFAQQARDRLSQLGATLPPNQVATLPGSIELTHRAFQAALVVTTRSQTLAQLAADPAREAYALYMKGVAYSGLEDHRQAADAYERALSLAQAVGDLPLANMLLGPLVNTYLTLGQYPEALTAARQLLSVIDQLNQNNAWDAQAQASTCLACLGTVYLSLGHYQQAEALYQQAIAQSGDNQLVQSQALAALAEVYLKQQQYEQAIATYQAALNLAYSYPLPQALTGLSKAYLAQAQPDRALEFAEEALLSAQRTNSQWTVGTVLIYLGDALLALDRADEASHAYQQALAIAQAVSARELEADALSKLGQLLLTQQQPELAIAFYKQAVNGREAIRQEVQLLDPALQRSYTDAIAPTYRELADLLLQQDRILEAQQVLELLKVQEIDDYLRTVRGNATTAQGLEALPPEQELLALYNAQLAEVVQLGRELEAIQKIEPGDRTPAQEQRRQEIEAAQRQLTQTFLAFIRTPAVVTLVDELRRVEGGENLEPRLLRSLQDNLQQLDPKAVLLYPLVLDDRLELILVTPYAPPIRRPVPVSRSELNRVITEFRSALENRQASVTDSAQQLYDWLIRPLETALQAAQAETIIYAPDSTLRYIPLAALYDGDRWLVENYRINNITALSLTDFNTPPQTPSVLAGAFSQGNYQFQVGDRTFSFAGLPYAGREVETLVATVPGTQSLFDDDFSRQAVENQMSDYSILHLATHAAFVTGQPDESFIVFGNGDRATFRDVELWNLSHADLVVLSACETAVGGNGSEILGFGYLMQQAGARAAIASLWQVSDGGTQVLMNAFYTALSRSDLSKAEALQQAQVAMIAGDEAMLGLQRAGIDLRLQDGSTPQEAYGQLSHPYYWAPFILIGNGL